MAKMTCIASTTKKKRRIVSRVFPTWRRKCVHAFSTGAKKEGRRAKGRCGVGRATPLPLEPRESWTGASSGRRTDPGSSTSPRGRCLTSPPDGRSAWMSAAPGKKGLSFHCDGVASACKPSCGRLGGSRGRIGASSVPRCCSWVSLSLATAGPALSSRRSCGTSTRFRCDRLSGCG